MTVKVLVAGLGRTGMGLASSLCDTHLVMGVDAAGQVCDCASRSDCDPDRLTIVNGDATSAFSMKKAGASSAQVAVACLGNDETNLAALAILEKDPVSVKVVVGRDGHHAASLAEGFSGLRSTIFTGSQFLVSPDQRSGFLFLAAS